MNLNNRIRHFYKCTIEGNGRKEQRKPNAAMQSSRATTALEAKQSLLAHHIRLVAQKRTNGLFVAGPSGLGKSSTIIRTILDSRGSHPVVVSSHLTPSALYRVLLNQRDEIVYIEDCDWIFADDRILEMLRSALWGSDGHRTVKLPDYVLDDFLTAFDFSSDDLPTAFHFFSRIIFSANAVPERTQAFDKLIKGVDIFCLEASNEEIVQQMRHLAARGYGMLSPAQCHEVVDVIELYGDSRRLSMVLYQSSLEKREYGLTADCEWRDLVKCQVAQLPKGDQFSTLWNDEDALEAAIRQFPNSVKDQERFWCKATGKSRASFFRLKKSRDQKGDE